MTLVLSALLFAAAALGCVLVGVQALMVRRFMRRPPRRPTRTPPISILKPLCGVDDSLEENLRSFAALDYPDYEVLLGLETAHDPACAVARSIVARWPRRFRIVFQHGAPGLNPKVNQLITLEKAAHHDILVVSDSNVRVDPRYLAEIAALFEDPEIALIGHPIAGVGEQTVGSLFDNLYLTAHCSAGLVAAKELAGQDLIVGKSMAFRRTDLQALGGFESVKDVLAEDYVMGRRIRELGRRVAIGRCVVQGISERRTVSGFYRRYDRWTIMQHKVLTLRMYIVQILVYPLFLAAMGFLVNPSRWAALGLGAVTVIKATLDLTQARLLRPAGMPTRAVLWVPVIDLLIGWCWLQGFLRDRVEWRGHELQVLPGTRLRPVAAEPDEPALGGLTTPEAATQ